MLLITYVQVQGFQKLQSTERVNIAPFLCELKEKFTLSYLEKLILKFIYSEKAKKFCEIFPLLLTVFTVVKSKVKIS